MSLISELQRRNVFRVGAAYVVFSWLIIQVAETIFPLFGFGDDPARIVVIVLAAAFLPALVFAWVFEVTPDGLKKDADAIQSKASSQAADKKFDRIILAVLALGISYFAIDKYVFDPARDQSMLEEARQQGRSDALLESFGDLSIAVIPFADMSADKSQEHMSDGLAEEMLNLLARIPELRVISRSSAFFFKDKNVDLPTMAEHLNVTYILEGSVRAYNNQIRVTAQLVEARSDTQLWTATFDREIDNIFQIQEEISSSIAQSLEIELLAHGSGTGAQAREVNPEAYNAFLIGNERLSLRTLKDIEAAVAQYEKSIKLEPDFAPSHVQLVHAMLLLEMDFYEGDAGSAESDLEKEEHLQLAIRTDPDLAEAYGVLGYFRMQRGRITEAIEALDKAIQLNPNYAFAYGWRADIAFEQGRYLDMLADREKAYALDPMSLQISQELANEYREFWRPRDADRIIERMFDRHPDHPLAYRAAILNLGFHGRHAEAQILTNQAIEALPENTTFRSWRPIGYYMMGIFDKARELGGDYYNFRIDLIEGKNEDALILLKKFQAENVRGALTRERNYHRIVGGEHSTAALIKATQKAISLAEDSGIKWNERCSYNLVYDLRLMGDRENDIDRIMARCKEHLAQRLKTRYLCPCKWKSLIYYAILDGRPDDAIVRANEWLDAGDFVPNLAVDPIFRLLSERPEYDQLIMRNNELMARQREIFLAHEQMGATEVLGSE